MDFRYEGTDELVNSGFSDPKADLFNFGDLATRLTSLYSRLDGSVSLIDGPWGVGKTTFVKGWIKKLEERHNSTIYIDAFASDFSDSPFEVVISALLLKIKDMRAESGQEFDRLLSAGAKLVKQLGAPASRIAIKAATLGLVGQSEIEDIRTAGEVLASDLGEISEDVIKRLLEETTGRAQVIGELKEAIRESVELLRRQNDPDDARRLIVIIDELDRCRPDFALGMLEIIKHFFEVKGVNLVLVAQFQYLSLSVKHRYGMGDYSDEYLEKFYDFVVNLDINRDDGHRRVERYISYLYNSDRLVGVEGADVYDLKNHTQQFTSLFNLSLRQIRKIIANIGLVYASRLPNEGVYPLAIRNGMRYIMGYDEAPHYRRFLPPVS